MVVRAPQPSPAAGSADARRFRRALEGLLGVPATEGNRVDVLRNGDEIFPAMLDAINSATSTVDFLTFIYWKGTVGEEFAYALADRARAGVRVRVLLDALGSHSMDRRLLRVMSDAGATVELFRPVRPWHILETNHRTHRKVLICDERVGFTGGVGIADVWRGDARNPSEWRDTHFRIAGPAVDGLRAAFVDNWAETGRARYDPSVDRLPDADRAGDSVVQVVRGAAETGWSDITTLVRSVLALAQRRVRIATAYFAPDDATSDLLCETARRGVQVEVLLPGPHIDKRFCQLASEAQYACLLDAGVDVYSFQPSMLHAKVMTIDATVAVIGSANFNHRSLSLDEEVDLVVFDPAVVERLDADYDADLERSTTIEVHRWNGRRPTQRAKEAVIGLFNRQM